MTFGKKQRYIEVFQCSGEDMNNVLTGVTPSTATATGMGTTTPTSSVASSSGSTTPSSAPGILASGMLPLTTPPPPPPPVAAGGGSSAAAAVTPQVSSASTSLTGLDPLGQAASAAQYASNPFLMASQNLASLGQNPSQLTAAQQYQQHAQTMAAHQHAANDPQAALRAAYGAQVPTTQASAAGLQQLYAQQGLYGANPAALAAASYGQPGLLQFPGSQQMGAAGGLMVQPGLLRLPGAGAAPSLNPALASNPAFAGIYGAQPGAAGLNAAMGLMQNPMYAAQQRLLLQQQQNAAAVMAAQQQQLQRQPQAHLAASAQYSALLAAQQSAAAITGKRSFDQAFVGAPNGVGGKRAYSSNATISANPTSYNSAAQSNGTS